MPVDTTIGASVVVGKLSAQVISRMQGNSLYENQRTRSNMMTDLVFSYYRPAKPVLDLGVRGRRGIKRRASSIKAGQQGGTVDQPFAWLP